MANNPSGTNQFGGFGVEAPYGSEAQIDRQIQATTPGLTKENTGRKFQRRATSSSRRSAPSGPPPPGAGLPPDMAQGETPPAVREALRWRAIASIPGAPPIARDLALDAERKAGLA